MPFQTFEHGRLADSARKAKESKLKTLWERRWGQMISDCTQHVRDNPRGNEAGGVQVGRVAHTGGNDPTHRVTTPGVRRPEVILQGGGEVNG